VRQNKPLQYPTSTTIRVRKLVQTLKMHILSTHSKAEAPLYRPVGENQHHLNNNYANTLINFEISVYSTATIPVKTTSIITSSNPYRIILIRYGTILYHIPPILALTPLLPPSSLPAPSPPETIALTYLFHFCTLFTRTLHLLISAWPPSSLTLFSFFSSPSSVHRKCERLLPPVARLTEYAGCVIGACDAETRMEYRELVCRVAW
jgi:hypothetical protein